MRSLQLISKDSCFPSLRLEYLHKLFGILQGRIVSSLLSSPFVFFLKIIYSIIYLYLCRLNGPLSYIRVIIQCNLIFLLLKLFLLWPLEALSIGPYGWLAFGPLKWNKSDAVWLLKLGHKKPCSSCQGLLNPYSGGNSPHVRTLTLRL